MDRYFHLSRLQIQSYECAHYKLPSAGSTLVMLVSAFADREKILNAYNIAVQERYRFFSFGDAMFIY